METEVLIIGGGATGTGLLRDLTLRGVNCILVEKRDINAGASGGNHGLLHSGARYVSNDAHSARECKIEGDILKRLAPHCIENTGGLFVAVAGDDERYISDFPEYCRKSGIPCQAVTPNEARDMEPQLSDHVIAAYATEDASVDPFRLSLENLSQAQKLGAGYLRQTEVVAFTIDNKRITTVRLKNNHTGQELLIHPQQVVNAAGAWAGKVAAIAGITIPMVYSKGTLLVTHSRLTQRVINRLRPPGDGDILVPGGTVSILGTTSVRTEILDDIMPTIEEVDLNIDQGSAMVPSIETTRFIRAYNGVRPLIGSETDGDRDVSRGFSCLDHSAKGVENFATITGGKLTTYRLMAEKTADLICGRLGVSTPCRTALDPLPADMAPRWTEPGLAPRLWIKQHEPDDILLCECEMVPASAIDNIIASLHDQTLKPALMDIGRRSRVGKGSCQGSFCGVRILAHMYDRGDLTDAEGLEHLRQFLKVRWRGERPMLWDMPIIQADLQEALHCGLYGLELPT